MWQSFRKTLLGCSCSVEEWHGSASMPQDKAELFRPLPWVILQLPCDKSTDNSFMNIENHFARQYVFNVNETHNVTSVEL